MPSRKALLPAAIAAVLVAASPAAADPAPAADPPAHAAGGEAPPVIPAIVRTRIRRSQTALDRFAESVDDGDVATAANAAKVIRRQMTAAWRGVKYTIKHPPPPVADDARLAPSGAHASGDGPAAPVTADPPTTALAVFQLQDDAVSELVSLTDGAPGSLLDPIGSVLADTLDRRDAAIEDVHDVPPAPDADDARVHRGEAHASGDGGAAATFDTVMPEVPAMLDDELQQIDALRSDAEDLQPAGRQLLSAASTQITHTEQRVKSYWPPVTDEE